MPPRLGSPASPPQSRGGRASGRIANVAPAMRPALSSSRRVRRRAVDPAVDGFLMLLPPFGRNAFTRVDGVFYHIVVCHNAMPRGTHTSPSGLTPRAHRELPGKSQPCTLWDA